MSTILINISGKPGLDGLPSCQGPLDHHASQGKDTIDNHDEI
jgi:hypothetical protein